MNENKKEDKVRDDNNNLSHHQELPKFTIERSINYQIFIVEFVMSIIDVHVQYSHSHQCLVKGKRKAD